MRLDPLKAVEIVETPQVANWRRCATGTAAARRIADQFPRLSLHLRLQCRAAGPSRASSPTRRHEAGRRGRRSTGSPRRRSIVIGVETADPTYADQVPRTIKGRCAATATARLRQANDGLHAGAITKNEPGPTMARSRSPAASTSPARAHTVGTVVNKVGRTSGWSPEEVTHLR